MFERFFRSEAASGVLLLGTTVLALAAANLAFSAPLYFGTLETYVGGLSVLHWINDGLMALFFLLVGLEIKHELTGGALSTWPSRALPGLAALGGMAALTLSPFGRAAAAGNTGAQRALAAGLNQLGGMVSPRFPDSPASMRVRR